MAQINLVFTWELESFSEIAKQPNLLRLRNEFKMRGHLLSQSLLIWEKVGVAGSWLLADFRNKKIYHIDKRNDPEMEVSEASWDPKNLISRFAQEVRGTHEGFIDWLKLFNLAKSDLEQLKRTDLLERRLALEITHDDLLAAYELLREILTSPRGWLVGLSKDNIQEIRECLGKWYEMEETIHGISLSTSKERHTEISQQIFQFCDEVKQRLGQVVTHLKSKKLEQLETQVNATVDEVVEDLKTEKELLQKQREEAEQNESTRQKEFAELKEKVNEELLQKKVSQHKVIFAEQTQRHQRAAWGWLFMSSLLVIGLVVGIISFGLLDILKLEGSAWTVVLQNIFKKGSVLTLFYFALNRSLRNYTAQKHLEIVNRHRQNALETFDEFRDASKDNPETHDAVLLAATNAIFDANQSGYLSTKTKGTESVNPIQQVFGATRSSSTRSED
ncbi:hypothetical protein F4X10_11810 [Candidatus Poribacteria bacterium]|nr:hypothetical protein [Candidatus Poribacteria bacterium]